MSKKLCDRCNKIHDDKPFMINNLPFDRVLLQTPLHTRISECWLCQDCARDLWHFLCNDKEEEAND